jgi:hypothetical protein
MTPATDDVMADHGGRMSRADSPFLNAFAAMDMDERWVSRSPQACAYPQKLDIVGHNTPDSGGYGPR